MRVLSRIMMLILFQIAPGDSAGISDECLNCIPKSWSQTPPDNDCIFLQGTQFCGRWGITYSYYLDCATSGNKTKDDFIACATNAACASNCARSYVDRYARSCRIQLRMSETDDIGCREYAAIHSGGPSGCQNIATDTDIQDRINNLSRVCPPPAGTTSPSRISVVLPAVLIPVVMTTALALIITTIVIRRRRTRRDTAKLRKTKLFECSEEVKQLITTRSIDKSSINLQRRVGTGHFGEIYMASLTSEATSKIVAVKKLKLSVSSTADAQHFFSEALVMASFNHENVLGLIGVCWEEGESPLIIMPYMGKGDLLTLIKSDAPRFSIGDIVNFSVQIAEGMKYLESNKFVHRDLAARNCLVSDYFLVKISDFGLSRNVLQSNYYQQAMEGESRQLPWKWMAIESITQGKFSIKSDVWSFGVVLWELFTYGSTPYPAVSNLDELETYLCGGARLAQPEKCPSEVYALMRRCWQEHSVERPEFSVIVETMLQLLRLHQNDSQYHYTFDFNGFHGQESRNAGFYVPQSLETLGSYCVMAKEEEYLDKREARASQISADIKKDIEAQQNVAIAVDYAAIGEGTSNRLTYDGNQTGSHLPAMQADYLNVGTTMRFEEVEHPCANADDQYIGPFSETSPLKTSIFHSFQK